MNQTTLTCRRHTTVVGRRDHVAVSGSDDLRGGGWHVGVRVPKVEVTTVALEMLLCVHDPLDALAAVADALAKRGTCDGPTE